MFIVDASVHVSQRNHPTDEVLKALRPFDVDSAIIFADSESPDLESQNRYVLRSGQEFDLFPFYYLGGNPFTDTRMDLEVPPNIEEYAGVRWHGWFGESPDRAGRVDRHELEFAVMTMETPEFEALMSALAFYSKPILFEEDFGVTAEFVARYGELRIIIPHMGALSGGEEKVLGRFYQNKNVNFTSGRGAIEQLTLRRLGPERILFASDYPHGSPADSMDKIKLLGLGDEDEALVFGENVERLLGIEAEDELEED